ncbi:hypothetical protein D043_0673B, partial [Vibrio parahaemolyticus EKP-021]
TKRKNYRISMQWT